MRQPRPPLFAPPRHPGEAFTSFYIRSHFIPTVHGLAYRLEVKVKVLTQLLFGCLQGDALLGNLFLDASKLIVIGSGLLL